MPGYAGGFDRPAPSEVEGFPTRGAIKPPTYEEVLTGTTGQAEVIKIEYDPAVIPFRKLLEVFFASHDPTTPNRQGADVGSQYRSIILYTTEEQRKEAQAMTVELNASPAAGSPPALVSPPPKQLLGRAYSAVVATVTKAGQRPGQAPTAATSSAQGYGRSKKAPEGKVVTELQRLDAFYPAEAYRQDYYAKNPDVLYAEAVIRPKIDKVRDEFSELLKTKDS